MFLENKYTNWYHKIIHNAKTLERDKKSQYFERHHIIPRSLGGSNARQNLVNLTAREHFLCHMLLPKMVQGNTSEYFKMLHCAILMKGGNRFQTRYCNSKLYESVKREYAEYRRSIRLGSVMSEETKSKISQSKLANPFRISDASKKIISEKAKTRARKPFSDEYKAKMSSIMKETLARKRVNLTS